MRILFSNPPWEVEGRLSVRGGSRWPHTIKPAPGAKRIYLPYPFFLGYAASYIEQNLVGSEVTFRDSLLMHETRDDFLKFTETNSFDYVVLEISTPSIEFDHATVRALHARCPSTKIIVVGQNIAYDGKKLLEQLPIHAAIKGECEKPLLKCLTTKQGGLFEFDLLTQDEMNRAPSPWRRDETIYEYFDVAYFHGYDPVLQMWGSRGCPFKCSFCTWPQSMTLNKVRYYSADHLKSELTDTLNRFPKFKAIYFDDDTFNLSDKHVLETCKVLREVGLPWSAMCRIDTLQESTWKAMADSGCVGVKVGVESGSQRILDKVIGKNLKLEDVRKFVPIVRSYGIKVHGTFMYGNPTETEDEMILTKKLIHEVGFDHIQESGAAPLAGTKLWKLNEQTHFLDQTDGKKYVEAIHEKLPQNS